MTPPPFIRDVRGRGIWEGDAITFPSQNVPCMVVRLPEHPRSIPGHAQGALHVEGHGLLVEVTGPITITNR